MTAPARPVVTQPTLDAWEQDFDYDALFRMEKDALEQIQRANKQHKRSQQTQQDQRLEGEEEMLSLAGSDSDDDAIVEIEMEGTKEQALPTEGSDSDREEEEAQLEEPTQPQ